jgi:hypothetical protein
MKITLIVVSICLSSNLINFAADEDSLKIAFNELRLEDLKYIRQLEILKEKYNKKLPSDLGYEHIYEQIDDLTRIAINRSLTLNETHTSDTDKLSTYLDLIARINFYTSKLILNQQLTPKSERPDRLNSIKFFEFKLTDYEKLIEDIKQQSVIDPSRISKISKSYQTLQLLLKLISSESYLITKDSISEREKSNMLLDLIGKTNISTYNLLQKALLGK